MSDIVDIAEARKSKAPLDEEPITWNPYEELLNDAQIASESAFGFLSDMGYTDSDSPEDIQDLVKAKAMVYEIIKGVLTKQAFGDSDPSSYNFFNSLQAGYTLGCVHSDLKR